MKKANKLTESIDPTDKLACEIASKAYVAVKKTMSELLLEGHVACNKCHLVALVGVVEIDKAMRSLGIEVGNDINGKPKNRTIIASGTLDIWRTKEKIVPASKSISGKDEHGSFGYTWENGEEADMKRMMQMYNGVPPEIHCWNMITIGGKHYFIDFTIGMQKRVYDIMYAGVDQTDNENTKGGFDYEHEDYYVCDAKGGTYDFVNQPVNHLLDKESLRFMIERGLLDPESYMEFCNADKIVELIGKVVDVLSNTSVISG